MLEEKSLWRNRCFKRSFALISFSCLIDITAGNNQENQADGRNAETASLKADHSWNTGKIGVPKVPTLTISAKINVNNTCTAATFAWNLTHIFLLVVYESSLAI